MRYGGFICAIFCLLEMSDTVERRQKKKETYIKFNTQFMCAKTIMRREDIKLNNGENVRVWSIELILFTGIFIDLNEIIHHT